MKHVINTFEEISRNFSTLSDNCSEDINKAAELIILSLQNNGKIMFCGNGGSASDSQHLSSELVGKYQMKRKPISSIALTTDTSAITAISNDFSFNDIFSRQIEALGKEGDVLYATSTSGKSKNILNAIKKANELKIKTIGLTGINDSNMHSMCDIVIKAPSLRTDRIQEMHIAIGHVICELIEKRLC
tara:strand:- start:2360 stop:2923 length:564 start_codon:yes stop_codon:yes gene_type:complete